MTTMICIHCGKVIPVEEHFMYPLDSPYINIFFHKSCFASLGGYEAVTTLFTENESLVYNYINKVSKNKTK